MNIERGCGVRVAKTEKNLEVLKKYLARLESNRVKDEHLNKRSYSHARELSAVVSLYEHGNEDAKKMAARILYRG